jgi:hypothetical protein
MTTTDENGICELDANLLHIVLYVIGGFVIGGLFTALICTDHQERKKMSAAAAPARA